MDDFERQNSVENYCHHYFWGVKLRQKAILCVLLCILLDCFNFVLKLFQDTTCFLQAVKGNAYINSFNFRRTSL